MTLYPTSIETGSHPGVCQQPAYLDVGSRLQDDIDREARIQHHREQMEAAMREYSSSGCFDARGLADWHRIQFEREIASRSPEQVVKMERERGFL